MVNTLPLPERAAEVLQNSSCVATLVEHGILLLFFLYFILFLLKGLQQVMKKHKKRGVCECECVCVGEAR